MKTVIIATKNKGKAKEFSSLFADYGIEVKTLLDYPLLPDVEETGKTFEENAILKAETIAEKTGKLVIADDSGLSIDALDGRPGVYSARYAGAEKSDEANIEKVLAELKGVPADKRTARFHCVLAVARPGEKTATVTGVCEGKITLAKQGTNGFGYDPIFFAEEFNKTMAELKPEEKHSISHRGQAMRKLGSMLSELIGGEAG
ncbi:XTP/dITP diphosphatase [Bacillus badius]|uniref:dITP/XTP pyrophosphatase n=1 Tax=Bacillus badius TaxID=1455 RepID=A0ABR5ATC7_BACBA|nr:XTP/dITP diphosphatase [Bacillus badius]KIL77924.1 Nucleoside 5-triphosphatase RdgB (dHAPTP, dITP, XTP-specific) [Bacillus badius]MED4716362.1 XTP/dITP diphosphatase [Bacillus badius]GLY10148.1 non-canonical purine NTP pyrophosphatase [Bacillus badius]